MAKDYKHSRRRGGVGLSGTSGLLTGLSIGLAVAAGVYVYDRGPGRRAALPAAPIASEQPLEEKPAPASQTAEPGTQYDFYDVLPKLEVVVPDKEKDAPRTVPSAIDKPGAYLLQAGSYRNHADADRVRAQLALQGIESRVEKFAVDGDTWHRVRIGPITNLKTLEDTRRKLREAQIDALVIKAGG